MGPLDRGPFLIDRASSGCPCSDACLSLCSAETRDYGAGPIACVPLLVADADRAGLERRARPEGPPGPDGGAGPYLDPPGNAAVPRADQTSRRQASERTQPVLPPRPGIPGRQARGYARHGATCPSAATRGFPTFPDKTAAGPGIALHVVPGHYAARTHQDIRTWSARPQNQPITPHVTPASCSRLTLAECLFSLLTRPAIRPGPITSARQPTPPPARPPATATNTPGRSPGPQTPTRSPPASTARRLNQDPYTPLANVRLLRDCARALSR
jgi:hypothetical protein